MKMFKVAPGMKTKLEFIIHAAEHKDLTPDADGKYHYAAEVELKSEWEILHIPVKAGKLGRELGCALSRAINIC